MALGSLGDVFFSIFTDDKTKEGLDSAKNNWVTTTGDIINAIDSVSGKIEGLAKDHAEVASSSERVSIISGIEADKIQNLAVKYTNAYNTMSDNLKLEEKLGKAKGMTADQMDLLIPKWQKFAEANEEQASVLMGKLSPAWKQFGITVNDQPQYFDKLTYLFAKTSIDADTFATQINRTGPSLSDMGISLDEAGALLLTLSQHGITGRVAMGELKKAIDETEKSGLKGRDAYEAIAKSLGYSTEEVDKNVTAMNTATGITEKLATAEMKQYTTMEKGTVEIQKATFGFTGFSEVLDPLAGGFQLVATNGIALYAIMQMFPGIAGSITGAFSGLGTTITGSLGGLSGAASSAAVGIGGAVVAGIAIGFAGVWALDKAGILSSLSNLGRDIEKSPMGKEIMGAMKIVLAPIGSLGAGIIDIVRGDFDKIGPDMVKPFEQAGASIQGQIDFITGIFSGFTSSMQSGAATVGSAFGSLESAANSFGSAFSSGVGSIVSWAQDIFSGIGEAFSGMAGQFMGVFNNLVENIQKAIEGTFQGFVSLGYNIIVSLVNGLLSAGNMIVDTFKNIFSGIASFFGGLTGARAEGGPVMSGGSYLVGENGPEMFVPSVSGAIVPNNYLSESSASSTSVSFGAGSIVVNAAPGQDPAEIADAVYSLIAAKISSQSSARGYRA